MEETTISTKKYIVNYGLVLGLIWIAYGLIRYTTDNVTTRNLGLSIIELSIQISIIVYGIYSYKSTNNGYLKLGQAIKIGTGIVLIGAFLAIIWNILLKTLIEPDMMNEILASEREVLINQNPNMPQEQIDENMAMAGKLSSLYVTSALVLVSDTLLGFVISLFAGAIMQKKRNEY
ncbi:MULTISPECIES: DUF4199 domain-containing protein [Aquimarina]|uniref:DUF4199 domain-containing protein n=1 Tax=Aquimarina TaxID=290174 RepID=UPI000D69DC05|nr:MULTISPECIES: DUF4199 domain-containing protein [Aquimarina]